jgi:phosphoglycerate dehydrogenase-like enzyme
MPTVLVHPGLPVRVTAADLRDRREDLTVLSADTAGVAADEPAADDIAELVQRAGVFVCSNKTWDDAYLARLAEGDWVQTVGAGYDAYPIDRFEERGIRLTNASGIHGPAAGEHTFALALAFSRGLRTYVSQQHEHKWDRHTGSELTGRRLTVLGLGAIGEAIAERGQAFGMDVRGVKQDPSTYDGCLPAAAVFADESLPNLLPDTDLLVVVIPLMPATRGLVDAEVLAALPNDAILVNIARGSVVDTDDLLAALDRGEIAGAGLDVFDEEPLPPDSPLWDHDDVIVTPHVAGVSDRYPERFVDLFLSTYDGWREDGRLDHRVV